MSEEYLSEMENLFMALADKTRLRLLNLMREDEICVCFFTEVLGESQPKVSRHLANLRNARIVEARRDGKWMHYRIVEPENYFAAQVLRDTLHWLESQDEMKKDYEKLSAVCSVPNALVSIMRAPKPNVFVEADISSFKKEELETYLL